MGSTVPPCGEISRDNSGNSGDFALTAALTKYRMNDVLLDLAIRETGDTRFTVAHHSNVEMYASSASYLVSAGGVFKEGPPPAVDMFVAVVPEIAELVSDANHEWSLPTVIIPTHKVSADIRDMIRFGGREDTTYVAPARRLADRENTCVGPGFACGLAPRLGLVETVDRSCFETEGNWRFYDLSRQDCLGYGFYLAFYEAQCDTKRCREGSTTGTFGLLEIGEAAESTFSAFMDDVLQNNPDDVFVSDRISMYTTTTGKTVAFEVDPAKERVPLYL